MNAKHLILFLSFVSVQNGWFSALSDLMILNKLWLVYWKRVIKRSKMETHWGEMDNNTESLMSTKQNKAAPPF